MKFPFPMKRDMPNSGASLKINLIANKKLPYKRSIPYFNALLKAGIMKRMNILQSFPSFVVDDMIEILYNVVLGKVDIGRRAVKIQKLKKPLLDIVHTKGKKGKRSVIYKQSGGFLGALIPIILSVLGSTML
jgi:hypothetical protein